MSDFGDFDPEDALDHEPADPEQVARKIHAYRIQRGLEASRWDDLSPGARLVLIAIVADLLAWMKRQGSTP